MKAVLNKEQMEEHLIKKKKNLAKNLLIYEVKFKNN